MVESHVYEVTEYHRKWPPTCGFSKVFCFNKEHKDQKILGKNHRVLGEINCASEMRAASVVCGNVQSSWDSSLFISSLLRKQYTKPTI